MYKNENDVEVKEKLFYQEKRLKTIKSWSIVTV